MTLAELTRAIESKKRQEKERLKELATFNYIQADLIGRSIARLYSSSAKMPQIQDIYPSLFETETEKQKEDKRMEISAIRFRMFAQAYNKKYNKEVGEE